MPLLIWQDKAMYSLPPQGAAFAACATPHHLPRKDQAWLCDIVVWGIRQWAARLVKANVLILNRDVLDWCCWEIWGRSLCVNCRIWASLVACVVILVSDDSRHLTCHRFNALRQRTFLLVLVSEKDELSPLLMCVENRGLLR